MAVSLINAISKLNPALSRELTRLHVSSSSFWQKNIFLNALAGKAFSGKLISSQSDYSSIFFLVMKSINIYLCMFLWPLFIYNIYRKCRGKHFPDYFFRLSTQLGHDHGTLFKSECISQAKDTSFTFGSTL